MSISVPVYKNRRFLAALGFTILFLALLIQAIPYSTGYGFTKFSLGRMVWQLWNYAPEWGHGMFVPFICAGLLYWKRDKIAQLPVQGSNWALIPIFLCLILYWLGLKAEVHNVGFIAIQFLIASLLIWFFGWRFFMGVSFMWGFLWFAWPFVFLDAMVANKLRLVMANLSYHILNLIGIPCISSGSGIRSAPDFAAGLPVGARFQIDIANPCSGIHSLFALTMLAALYGYAMLPKNWQRWILFLSSAPLAILGNMARIIMLTFGTILFGSGFALGTEADPSIFHMTSGFVAFGVAVAGMYFLAMLLEQDWSAIRNRLKAFALEKVPTGAEP